MKILIIDDHAIFRASLRRLLMVLLLVSDVDISEANNSVTALQAIRKQLWDVVLLDINLPNRNGIDVLKQIKKTRPSPPVLMLSMHSEQQYAVRAISAGADGYLTKDTSPEELTNAIRQLVTGNKYINPSVAHALASHIQAGPDNRKPHERLSAREYDVFIKLSSGKTVTQIAESVLLSVKTISTYRTRILSKMQLKNNAELTQYAIQHQLLIEHYIS